MYDKNNVFYKIINKEIQTNIFCENDNAMSFKDINPQSEVHYLVISKGYYTDIYDFNKNASTSEILDFWHIINLTIDKLKINAFRIISNCIDSQEIYHFHIHILSSNKIKN